MKIWPRNVKKPQGDDVPSDDVPSDDVRGSEPGGESRHCRITVLCAAGFSAFVVLTFAFAGWNLRSDMDGWSVKNFPMYPGDEVVISQLASDLSSILCQQYGVTVGNGRAVVYLMDADKMVTSPAEGGIQLEVSDYFQRPSRSFYLLAGSELSLSACATDIRSPLARSNVTVAVYRLPGARHIGGPLTPVSDDVTRPRTTHHTLDPGTGHEMVIQKLTINPTSECDSIAYSHHVTESSQYKVAVESWPVSEFVGHVKVKLWRQYYSPAAMLDACYYDTRCVFNLNFDQNVEVIVLLQNDPNRPEAAAMLSTFCVPRLSVWLCLYVVVPLLVVIISLACCFCCRPRKESSAPKKDTGTSPSVHGLENPTFASSEKAPKQNRTKTLRVSLSEKEMQNCGI